MSHALVLIDIQNDYFPGGKMELTGSVDAARQAACLLACAREVQIPVVLIQHIALRPGAKRASTGRGIFSRGSESRL